MQNLHCAKFESNTNRMTFESNTNRMTSGVQAQNLCIIAFSLDNNN